MRRLLFVPAYSLGKFLGKFLGKHRLAARRVYDRGGLMTDSGGILPGSVIRVSVMSSRSLLHETLL